MLVEIRGNDYAVDIPLFLSAKSGGASHQLFGAEESSCLLR